MSGRFYGCFLLSMVHAFAAAGGEPDWDGIERQILQPKTCPPGMRLVQSDHPDQGYTQACLDEKGRQHGWALMFYPEGQVKRYSEAEGGRFHGKSMGWYREGQREYFVEFQQGDKHGLEVRWYENGQKMSEGRYRQGLREGLWRYWFPNGQLRKRGRYRQGNETGEWEYWKQDGSPSDFEVYVGLPKKPPAPADVEKTEAPKAPPRTLPAGVLLGAPLVEKKLLLEDNRLGAIKQVVNRGPEGFWLLGEEGALLVDSGFTAQKWVKFPHRAEAVSLLDLEGDGKEEFLIHSRLVDQHGFQEVSLVLDSAGARHPRFEPLWRMHPAVAGDLDGDGKAEVAAIGGWRKAEDGDFEWGIEILDANGKVVRQIPAAGVSRVWMADRDGDGRPEILSLDERGYLQAHEKEGQGLFVARIEHPIYDATLCSWPDPQGRPHLLYWYETSIWLVDALSGKNIRFDAPGARTGTVAGAVGVPVRLRRDRPPYLAAAVNLKRPRALLFILTPKGRVEYLEVFDEPVEALATSDSTGGVQGLLVGGRGKLWSYRFLEEKWESLAEAVYRVLAFGTPNIKLVDVEPKNVARQLRDGWFEWTVFLEGSQEALQQIACVHYSLSPTFPDNNQLVCERGSGPYPFALTREGWGMFTMPVRVFLKSGPVQEYYYRIKF